MAVQTCALIKLDDGAQTGVVENMIVADPDVDAPADGYLLRAIPVVTVQVSQSAYTSMGVPAFDENGRQITSLVDVTGPQPVSFGWLWDGAAFNSQVE